MSENITSGQEKPQNSPSVQQTSSQQPMMRPHRQLTPLQLQYQPLAPKLRRWL